MLDMGGGTIVGSRVALLGRLWDDGVMIVASLVWDESVMLGMIVGLLVLCN